MPLPGDLLQRLSASETTWADLEKQDLGGLWAGREVDETGSTKWLKDRGKGPLFIKGRMIDRFGIREAPSKHVAKPGWTAPRSVDFERIAWRDVSRPNQKRRVTACLVPAGCAAGNSLGIAYFKDGDPIALRCLLGVFSSLTFEFQLRSRLATGHVSLTSVRKVSIPKKEDLAASSSLQVAVSAVLEGRPNAEAHLEAVVAQQVYGLTAEELDIVLDTFAKLTESEKDAIRSAYSELGGVEPLPKMPTIPNHRSARLSEVDLAMVHSVPPGGNWKNIPESIPSRRLDQIRASFKRGEGSRSTYYGRLRPDKPSYTINTYFSRPGNGCHIHFEQDRVISQREAARLQSFPDDFVFDGSQTAINTQIGNAVPPLLAYQIARSLGKPGIFVDLFAGAGGLGLGFKWAGWKPIVANDIEGTFLRTYERNVHNRVVCGSITDKAIQDELADIANTAKNRNKGLPFWILGGPPCQGFSTAGHRRTMRDERNHLVWDYRRFLERTNPDGFVFENVTGLLNMSGGGVFREIKKAFKSIMPALSGFVLKADEYAVPQRRSRVILIGRHDGELHSPPERLTSCDQDLDLFSSLRPAISVQQAISDLPPLQPGQDGSALHYAGQPRNAYQELMRSKTGPEDYLNRVRNGELVAD